MDRRAGTRCRWRSSVRRLPAVVRQESKEHHAAPIRTTALWEAGVVRAAEEEADRVGGRRQRTGAAVEEAGLRGAGHQAVTRQSHRKERGQSRPLRHLLEPVP